MPDLDETSPVRVLSHPVAGGVLAQLRAQSTAPEDFRALARRMGVLLTVEAARDLDVVDHVVTSPLGPAPARSPAPPVVAVPVLRAGLGLLPGLHDVMPSAAVGMVGLVRDEQTLEPHRYYFNVPPLEGAWVLVLEPMLATGGSASRAVGALDDAGATLVTVVSVVATNQGIDRVHAENPAVRLVTAAIDPELDSDGFIVPGLGDFGDRCFGTT